MPAFPAFIGAWETPCGPGLHSAAVGPPAEADSGDQARGFVPAVMRACRPQLADPQLPLGEALLRAAHLESIGAQSPDGIERQDTIRAATIGDHAVVRKGAASVLATGCLTRPAMAEAVFVHGRHIELEHTPFAKPLHKRAISADITRRAWPQGAVGLGRDVAHNDSRHSQNSS